MTSHDDVPYADPEPLSELIEECRCVEAECAAHGVNLHPEQRHDDSPHHAPVVIDEVTRHILDGYPDYGS
jgi:hypothetical protein